MNEYDPFARGRFPVGVRTFYAADVRRNRKGLITVKHIAKRRAYPNTALTPRLKNARPATSAEGSGFVSPDALYDHILSLGVTARITWAKLVQVFGGLPPQRKSISSECLPKSPIGIFTYPSQRRECFPLSRRRQP
jgi:hypothetical protein